MCISLALTGAAAAQPSDVSHTGTISGTVVNSVTREPIGRALVVAAGNRAATLTDDRGHFSFTVPFDSATGSQNVTVSSVGASNTHVSGQALMLMARRPGFLETEKSQVLATPGQHVTLALVQEALIVGRVVLPKGEVQNRMQVSLYRREVQDGRAHWQQAAMGTTRLDGEFRFAELQAGDYRLFSAEAMDRDPQDIVPGGPMYGYPPVFYPAAEDFDASAVLHLTPGKIVHTELKPSRTPYYEVRIELGGIPIRGGMMVNVFPHGSEGPGYSLGYDPQSHAIRGTLPNGSYTVKASTFGEAAVSGELSFVVAGGAVAAGPMALVGARSIPVEVREEFQETAPDGKGPRIGAVRGDFRQVYRPIANLRLEPVSNRDGMPANLHFGRDPEGPLFVENVFPGRYWVRVMATRGYPAAVTAGGLDLLQNPLVVDPGATIPNIEITLRDKNAELHGVIEGSPAAMGTVTNTVAPASTYAYLYCIPTPDSTGEYTEAGVGSNGDFDLQSLAPGVYRLLAFKEAQSRLEYRNPEAMKAYESKGVVVRLADGQQEKVRVPLVGVEP